MKAQISIDRCVVKYLMRLLALSLTLAVTAPPLFAQEWDHLNGRDKAHDPTGVWLVNTSVLGPDGKPLLHNRLSQGRNFNARYPGRKRF